MIVIPAIDLRDGRVVRLKQGDYSRQCDYDLDALELATRYAAAGAKRLHVVDLDAARDGVRRNRSRVFDIAESLDIAIQAGGGVREEADLVALFRAKVAAAVVGSVAVREPARVIEWARAYGRERIVVALDTRCVDGVWTLPIHGWTVASGINLYERIESFLDAGLDQFLITDIERDGMLAGPSLELYAALRQRFPQARIQASGGVDGTTALAALKGVGVAGAIVGRALLEGRLDLDEALAC